MRRNIACNWDLVSAGAVREQLTFFIPDDLFHREPAHALNVRAFDLAFVDCGIDRLAHIMNDVDALQPPLTRTGVNFCLRDGRPVTVIVEGLALKRREIIGNVRRHVEAA